jgi:septal ring factor EnvC (AmiA/AmiB activator)
LNTDFLFACRVCHSPLLAAVTDRGAVVDCPNCAGVQAIPTDPSFGSNPSSYLSDAALVGDSETHRTRPLLRRVRLRRDTQGRVLVAQVPAAEWRTLHCGAKPPDDSDRLKAELETLRQKVAEQERLLAEWQTCHDSVERELKRSSARAKALQAKINEASNELAQARHDLKKARTEADNTRKANDALNRQLQTVLKASRTKAQPPPKQKSAEKPSGEMAA